MQLSRALAFLSVLALLAAPSVALARTGGGKTGGKPDKGDEETADQTAAPASSSSTATDGTDGDDDHDPTCDCARYRHRMPRVSITLGGSWERYTGENLATNNAGASLTGASHFDLDLDFGFYFRPTSDHLVFGLAFDLGTDGWSNSPSIARISQLFIGAKATYFFSGDIGRGLYVHGDLGPVAFMNQLGNQTGRTTQSTQTGSPLGIGVRLGTGYAFRVWKHVSILAAFDWSYRTAGASSAMPMTLSGGILF